ncbi:MBL fold metallo-hydrolase [Roseovarius sp. 2305UL8-3]|uniref:MBL fold metallo-hydrolase n=1 Tax=Roseovarius conchicola TaxID=3121636 RepID=UPI003528C4FD
MTTQLDWFGCATFRLKTAGLTVFLDAYIDRVPGADGREGASADDISECDFILIGHSHFDHIWGAECIALRTGAPIIGSYETIRIMAAAGVPDHQLWPVSGGETIPLGHGVRVEVYPALHACNWADYDDQDPEFSCIGGMHVDYLERRIAEKTMLDGLGSLSADLATHMARSDQGGRGDGGTLCFIIDTPDGRLFFRDTPGRWTGITERLSADVGILAASGRANTDGEPIQGSLVNFLTEDVRMLGLKRAIICHHDAWLGPVFARGNFKEIRAGMTRRMPDCDVVELDYDKSYPVFAEIDSLTHKESLDKRRNRGGQRPDSAQITKPKFTGH